jgi:hypothetical protein
MWAPIYNPPAQHFPASCNDDDSVRRQREDMWVSASDSFAVFWAASLAALNARYAVRALNFYFYIYPHLRQGNNFRPPVLFFLLVKFVKIGDANYLAPHCYPKLNSLLFVGMTIFVSLALVWCSLLLCASFSLYRIKYEVKACLKLFCNEYI